MCTMEKGMLLSNKKNELLTHMTKWMNPKIILLCVNLDTKEYILCVCVCVFIYIYMYKNNQITGYLGMDLEGSMD